MRRWTVCALLALSLCAGTAKAAVTMTGLETETVSRVWEENAFFPRMQALTGVETLPHGVDDEKAYAAMLEGMLAGELPADALFKANLSREQETALLDAGAIIDLAPLIEENMPNLSALLDAHPDWRATITLPDGRIPSLPQVTEQERQVCVWIDRAWLETLGIPMPQTLNELTAALLAMKDRDPNGNGKRDEIAADLIGVYEMRWLLPYFGIVADDYNLARGADGALVFAPEMEGYRAFVELLRDWHAQGILTNDAFTTRHSTREYELSASTSNERDVTGGLIVTVTPYTHVPEDNIMDFEPLLLAGPDGKTRWRDLLGGIWTGCFAVTSACDDPAAALRWADALYGEEGALLCYAGAEGEDYAYGENGYWSFNVDGVYTVENIRAESIMYTGAVAPGIVPNDFLELADSDIDRYVLERNARAQAVAERVTRPYLLDAQAQSRADALAAQLGALVDKGIARFASEETELTDESWAAFLDSLREAGSGEMVALFAEAERAEAAPVSE